jgi:integrase
MPGHHFSKSWQYIKKKFGFNRSELTIYGGRHTKATWFDAARIPDRIRDRVMGHASKRVAGTYGANKLTSDEAKLLLSKSLPIEEENCRNSTNGQTAR